MRRDGRVDDRGRNGGDTSVERQREANAGVEEAERKGGRSRWGQRVVWQRIDRQHCQRWQRARVTSLARLLCFFRTAIEKFAHSQRGCAAMVEGKNTKGIFLLRETRRRPVPFHGRGGSGWPRNAAPPSWIRVWWKMLRRLEWTLPRRSFLVPRDRLLEWGANITIEIYCSGIWEIHCCCVSLTGVVAYFMYAWKYREWVFAIWRQDGGF